MFLNQSKPRTKEFRSPDRYQAIEKNLVFGKVFFKYVSLRLSSITSDQTKKTDIEKKKKKQKENHAVTKKRDTTLANEPVFVGFQKKNSELHVVNNPVPSTPTSKRKKRCRKIVTKSKDNWWWNRLRITKFLQTRGFSLIWSLTSP